MDKKDGRTNEQKNLNIPQSKQTDREVKKRPVRFVEEGVKTQYAGIFNIGFGAEEVVLVFGNPSIDPHVVRIESKVAVSIKTAKRLAMMLSDMIRRYEAKSGAIDIAAPKVASDKSPKLQ